MRPVSRSLQKRRLFNSATMFCFKKKKKPVVVDPVMVFGGVEGGGTHSTTMLYNEKGEKLAEVEGPSTNLYQIGIPETNNRISLMVKQALNKAGLQETTKLKGKLSIIIIGD